MKYRIFLVLLLATLSFSSHAAEAETNAESPTEELNTSTATDKIIKNPIATDETIAPSDSTKPDNKKPQPTTEEEEEPECD